MLDLFPTSLDFLGSYIEKCPFTYWLNGRWFHQIVDLVNFNMKLNGMWFPQTVDRDSGNIYPIYIYIYTIVVLASEPVGGRSRATELPCSLLFLQLHLDVNIAH